jgi:hypothetical protein
MHDNDNKKTKTPKPAKCIVGSVSSGSLRREDLIPAFLDAFEDIYNDAGPTLADKPCRILVNTIYKRISVSEDSATSYDYYADECSDHDLAELIDLLQEFAPPYCYFGSHPGDGADFGFWIIDDVVQQVKDDGGLVVDDLSEVTQKEFRWGGVTAPELIDVLHVNDHGNVTFYSYNAKEGEFIEIWSVV